MPEYRRTDTQGATYFFTVNCLMRGNDGPLVHNVDLLRSVIRKVKADHPFTIDAMVVLPDHLHCIWTLPETDANFPIRWSLIKANFSRELPITSERLSESRQKRGERGVWQRRYWEHQIRDQLDYQNHVDYIHFNPVKHGYCTRVLDWPYSSFHNFVQNGVYPVDWGVEPVDITIAGEIES